MEGIQLKSGLNKFSRKKNNQKFYPSKTTKYLYFVDTSKSYVMEYRYRYWSQVLEYFICVLGKMLLFFYLKTLYWCQGDTFFSAEFPIETTPKVTAVCAVCAAV